MGQIERCAGCGGTGDSRRGFLGVVGRAGAAVVGGIAGMGLIGTPASAHVISGGWADNHVICNGCTISTGNIVRLWQNLLWSANVSGTWSNCNDWTDGIFGSATASATWNWQNSHGLLRDGIVGEQSWTHMRSHLYSYAQSDTHFKYAYPENQAGGRARTLLQRSKSNGTWTFQKCGPPTYRSTGH